MIYEIQRIETFEIKGNKYVVMIKEVIRDGERQWRLAYFHDSPLNPNWDDADYGCFAAVLKNKTGCKDKYSWYPSHNQARLEYEDWKNIVINKIHEAYIPTYPSSTTS